MDFRKFTNDNCTLILGGKNEETNEALIKQVEDEEEVFHTDAPGSPFVNIKGEPKKGDLKQAAIFCAAFSKDWKKNKNDVEIHRFKGKEIYKDKRMKTGTFGVKKFKVIKVKKKEIEDFLRKWEQ